MKLILFVVVSCLAFQSGKGAPKNAVYKFVRCNPEGDQANCVTQQSTEMAWSQNLPTKLPASMAQYLEAEPVEDESPMREEYEKEEYEEEYEEEEEEEEEETPKRSEEESRGITLSEDGSGDYEGSATDGMAEDWVFVPAESETGSGESWAEEDEELNKDLYMMAMDRFPHEAKPAEQELREDHLLKL